jgi:hypothetical protein
MLFESSAVTPRTFLSQLSARLEFENYETMRFLHVACLVLKTDNYKMKDV